MTKFKPRLRHRCTKGKLNWTFTDFRSRFMEYKTEKVPELKEGGLLSDITLPFHKILVPQIHSARLFFLKKSLRALQTYL